MTCHHYSCNLTVVIIYLKVVSLMGSLLHLIHLSLSGSNFSIQYPVIGLPPSSSGSNQVRVTASLVMSDGVTLVGGPGGSGKQCDFSLAIIHLCPLNVQKKIFDRRLDNSVKNLTKGILCNDWCVLCRFANAILVLSADPEDVLLHRCELTGFEGGMFHCGWELHPLLPVRLTAIHNVVCDWWTAIIPRRVPGQEAWLVGNLGNIEGSWRARFI